MRAIALNSKWSYEKEKKAKKLMDQFSEVSELEGADKMKEFFSLLRIPVLSIQNDFLNG